MLREWCTKSWQVEVGRTKYKLPYAFQQNVSASAVSVTRSSGLQGTGGEEPLPPEVTPQEVHWTLSGERHCPVPEDQRTLSLAGTVLCNEPWCRDGHLQGGCISRCRRHILSGWASDLQDLHGRRCSICVACPVAVLPRRPVALSIRYLSGLTRISGFAISRPYFCVYPLAGGWTTIRQICAVSAGGRQLRTANTGQLAHIMPGP